MKRYKGQIVEVLVEGESKNNPDVFAGYTSKNKLVNFLDQNLPLVRLSR